MHKKEDNDGSKEILKNNGFKTRLLIILSYLLTLSLFFILPLSYVYSKSIGEIKYLKDARFELDYGDSSHSKGDTQSLSNDVNPKLEPTGGVNFDASSTASLERINILLMGIDSREDNLEGRTDTLMVFSFDQASGTVDLLSIPRDTYTEIVGKGKKDKINHAYAFGGSEMTLNTVESLLDIEFNHYGVFNFTSFMKVIDTIGGIDVDVPFDFTEQDSKGQHDKMVFTKGRHTLTGEQALAYARMRHQDPEGDIGRGKRQQQVIQATIDKLKETRSVSAYLDIFYTIKDSIATDIRISDIPSLATRMFTIEKFNTLTVTGDSLKIDGIYYMDLYDNQLETAKERLNTIGVKDEELIDTKQTRVQEEISKTINTMHPVYDKIKD